MSEGGSLFNPGYLGTEFKWWIGQVADDATWRDNINPTKISNKNKVPGWGRRYKVRILGLHDWGGAKGEGIEDGQLPWANVMYPITAGGGQASAFQTPAIRQGNIVFGFWMDGSDQEVPVIMGILGNNPQTPLKYTTAAKNPDVTNNAPGIIATSGFAESVNPPKDTGSGITPTVPDKDLITEKPKSPQQQQEAAGGGFGAGGLNQQQFIDSQQARQDIEQNDPLDPDTGVPFKNLESSFGANYKQEAINKYVDNYVQEQTQERVKAADSPKAPAVPGATIEGGSTAPHLITAGDIKLDDKREEKMVLFKSDKQTESATKSIQLAMENLMKKVQKHLSAKQQYSDAVSEVPYDMDKEIDDTANEIAKYNKVIFNKMMEYTLKQYNKEQTASVSKLPATQRWQYSEVKEKFTEITLKEYNNITNDLSGQMRGSLRKQLDIPKAEAAIEAQQAGQTSYIHPITGKKFDLEVDANGDPVDTLEKLTSPNVPSCYAEDLVGHSIYSFQDQINDLNNKMIQNSNMYLKDIGTKVSAGNKGGPMEVYNNTTKKMEVIPTPGPITMNGKSAQTGGIISNMVAALNFLNTKSNVFPFEPPRNEAVSDYYQLSRGSGATSDDNQPNMKGIAEQITKYTGDKEAKVMDRGTKIPFLDPPKSQSDISWLTGRGSVKVSDLQDIPYKQGTIDEIMNNMGNDNQGNPKN